MNAFAIHITALTLSLLAATAAAQEPETPPRHTPGEIFRLTFPELPPTFFQMYGHDDGPPGVLVRLPDDYDPKKPSPLCVYLDGGNGGYGSNIGVPNRIGGTDRCITANFPLWKRALPDPDVPWSIGVDFADYFVISKAYATILERLHAELPNIDPETSIIGGHSNGAKTLAVLLSLMDENILSTFQGFFFIDGGFEWASIGETEVLGKKDILFLIGGGEENPEWWREGQVSRIRYYDQVARRLGMKRWRFVITPGVGHAFVPEYFEILREWAREVGK